MDNVFHVILTAPIKHDGQDHEVDAKLWVTGKQRDRLKKLGAAIDAPESNEDEEKDTHKDNARNYEDEEHQELKEIKNNELSIGNSKEDDDGDNDNPTGEDEEDSSKYLSNILEPVDPEEMTREELENELTAGGEDFPASIGNRALIARVKRLRKSQD